MTDGNYQSLTKAYINFKWNVFLFFILYIHFKELPCIDNLNTPDNFYSKYIEKLNNLQNFDVGG
jgi:hypothetical protein